jgi:hypothetical protein
VVQFSIAFLYVAATTLSQAAQGIRGRVVPEGLALAVSVSALLLMYPTRRRSASRRRPRLHLGRPLIALILVTSGLVTVAIPPAQAAGNIAYRNASSNSTTSSVSSLTINAPAGLQDSDLMIAMVSSGHFSNTCTISAPAGWTAIDNLHQNFLDSRIFYKVASNEGASYDFTQDCTTAMTGGIVAYSGADTSNPIAAHTPLAETVDQTTHTTGSVSVTSSSQWIISTFADENGSTWTPPSGDSERVDNPAVGWASTEINDTNASVTTGSYTKTATASVSTNQANMFTIVINSSPSVIGSIASITQTGYIFENDDATTGVDGNSQQTAGNTAITGVKKGERLTARFQLKNTGAPFDANLGLFYDHNDGIWSKVRAGAMPTTGSGSCAGDANWDCTTIDSTNTVADYNDLAVAPDGRPWVAYRYTANSDLRVATYVGTGGTGCDAGVTTWTCTNISTANSVGLYPSIAVDRSAVPWISYYDNTTKDLMVANYTPGAGTGCGAGGSTDWTCTDIENDGATTDRGQWSSLAFDASGNPWISYYDLTGGNLRVAHYVGAGGTGCAGGGTTWTCADVDTGPGTDVVGYYTSIKFDSAGSPWIAYQDNTINDAWIAKYVPGQAASGSCQANWSCTLVAATGNVGFSGDLAIAPDNTPYTAFRDPGAAGRYWVANYVGSSGSCSTLLGGSAAWNRTLVDDVTTGATRVNIAFAPDGKPWIAVHDGTTSANNIRIDRYVGGGGGSGCGTSGSADWICSGIDGSNHGGVVEGFAFGPDGTAWVAYNDTGGNDLRIANLHRGGEITITAGRAGANGATLSESHTDMSSATDTANRDDADCAGGATWNNGKWFDSENGSGVTLPDGSSTAQCTEVAFVIDTSQATAGTTYRFVLASKDAVRPDKGPWRGPIAITSYARLTVEASTSLRVSKDNLPASATDCTDTSWACISPATTSAVGSWTSMAIAPSGDPWVAYENNTAGSLSIRLAKYVGAGGSNCDIGASWDCSVVDSTTNTSTNGISMAIAPDATAWIAYYNLAAGGGLTIAQSTSGASSGCGTGTGFVCSIVDSGASNGQDVNIALDPAGNPWVAYYDGASHLRVARYVGAGGTGCTGGDGHWSCTNVAAGGREPSLAFDKNGDPWIAFRNNSASNVLAVAQYVRSGGTCANSTAWTCTTVDSTASIGYNPSIAFDDANTAWVSYQSNVASAQWTYIAKYVSGQGAAGACAANWSCGTIIDRTASSSSTSTSIAIDGNGKPWVAVNDGTSGDRRVDRYVGSSLGTGCAAGSDANWSCTTVSSANITSRHPGTIAFDRSGTPWITYYKASSDVGVAKLKLPPTQPSYQMKAARSGRPNAGLCRRPAVQCGSEHRSTHCHLGRPVHRRCRHQQPQAGDLQVRHHERVGHTHHQQHLLGQHRLHDHRDRHGHRLGLFRGRRVQLLGVRAGVTDVQHLGRDAQNRRCLYYNQHRSLLTVVAGPDDHRRRGAQYRCLAQLHLGQVHRHRQRP